MAAKPQGIRQSALAGGEIVVPVAFVVVVVLMVVPIPTALLDVLLAFNISVSLLVLLLAMHTQRPLEFSTFPSLLLVLTLFRLSLNIASTRLILGHGAEGPAAAGHVIQAFGHFVVGGNYIVGVVIFLILLLVNFVVITKGAGRIAEVAARFTLDAMPGKQLAVDAEMNAGLLTEDEARRRRRAIEAEADFYGAMDGASKFVRGDAIAGLLIALINILGGFAIGMLQGGLGILEAVQTYTSLTIGDGLVSQVPALLISTASGVIVTRAASGTDLGTEVTSQILFNPRVLTIVSCILGGFALVPGLPFLPFVVLSGVMGALALSHRGAAAKGGPEAAPAEAEGKSTGGERAAPGVPPLLDLLELEVGYELVPLVDAPQGGELIERIRSLRAQLAEEIGLAVPPVHIRDNLQLKPGEYAVRLKGVEIARAEVRMGCFLAIAPGSGAAGLQGVPTKEPAFGLDALWVPASERERASLAGCTVVDVATAIVTHLTELIRRYAAELLGRQDVQVLLDALAATHPKVVEELVPQNLTLGGVQKVLQNLLREGVSIRDTLTIVECLADHAPATKDPDVLTEYVRQALGRAIVQRITGGGSTLLVLTLAPEVEQRLADVAAQGDAGALAALEPGQVQRLIEDLAGAADRFAVQGQTPVLLCSAAIRRHVRRLTERFLPSLAVLSPAEIPASIEVRSLGSVGGERSGGADFAPRLAAAGGAP